MGTRKTASSRAPEIPAESIADVEKRAMRLVRDVAPGLRVEEHWGHPWFVGRDLVCLVGAFSRHVGMEFWRGSSIPDPDHLLEGTGKNLRHVKLRTVAEAGSPRLARLLGRAVALDRSEPRRSR